jgi:16S rRNA (adenine1518-N6/adenine1519-N6)-dimethyltransferase
LGQSFLVDRNILGKILKAGEVHRGDRVLEIGAGVGTLTHALGERCRRIVAVEIERPWKVIANLPYSIVTPLITRLLNLTDCFSLLLLMVQEEVAKRLIASPGKKTYGSLTVLAQYYADVRMVARVPRSVFYPRPRVDSVLLRLEPLPAPRVAPRDPALFFRLVRTAFTHRRKTLQNSLMRSGWISLDREEIQAILKRTGIDPHRRGETLTLQEFRVLADELLTEIKGVAA